MNEYILCNLSEWQKSSVKVNFSFTSKIHTGLFQPYQRRQADTCWWRGWSWGWEQLAGDLWPVRAHSADPWNPPDIDTGNCQETGPGISRHYGKRKVRRATQHNAAGRSHPSLSPEHRDTWDRTDIRRDDKVSWQRDINSQILEIILSRCEWIEVELVCIHLPALVFPPQVDAAQRAAARLPAAGVAGAAGGDTSSL